MDGKKSITHDQLTPAEVEVIRTTWSQVSDAEEMAIDFYNRLFYLYPFLRPLFKENIQLQARKFTEQISDFISNMKNMNAIETQLGELGKRHAAYEVKSQHYAYVKEALFYALKNHLTGEWSEGAEQAWIKFYQIMADQMMSASCQKKQFVN